MEVKDESAQSLGKVPMEDTLNSALAFDELGGVYLDRNTSITEGEAGKLCGL